MTIYRQKPSSCDGCRWRDIGIGYAAGSGPTTAKLAIVAESLGENEAQQGIPLVGWSGKEINRFLKNHGVRRDEVFCDNIVRCKPPAPSGAYKRTEKLPKDIISFCTGQHLCPILELVKPNAVIALGDYSLNFLTGKKGISKWRGSILTSPFGKIIPTYHPSWLVKGENASIMYPFVDFDIGKGVRESRTEKYSPPVENFNIDPNLTSVLEIISLAKEEKRVSIDIETCGGIWWTTVPLCIGFYFPSKNYAISVPFYQQYGNECWSESCLDSIINVIYEFLADETFKKTFQNGAYDIQVLESVGFIVNGYDFDTMIAHHAVACEKGVPHDLAFIGSIYTNFPFYKDDVKGEDNFALLDETTLRTYNCRDVAVTGCSELEIEKEIDELQVRPVFEHDMKLIRPLIKMQKYGVQVDRNLLESYRKVLSEKLEECEKSLRLVLGNTFNIDSNKQLSDFLFGDLGLEPISFTKKGKKPAVGLDSILGLSEQVTPEIEAVFAEIIEHRRVRKLRSTYFKEFILDAEDRIHTNFTLHVTPTGRLSSQKPNLQNIPKANEVARKIFVAKPGFALLSRDYVQLEVRILAEIAEDDTLRQAFASGKDIHSLNASDLFSVSEDKVVPDQRDFAKTFLYGAIIYGGTAATVRAQQLSRVIRGGAIGHTPSVKEIEALQQSFLYKHPAVTAYQQKIKDEVLRNKTIRVPVGGRLRIFLTPRDAMIRAAYNTPIQGSAAYIINDALIRLDEIIREPAAIILQVHDELILEVPQNEVIGFAKITKEVMEKPIEINGRSIIFPTTCEVGKSWGEMEEYDDKKAT